MIDADAWFGQLPGVVLAAAALITDPAGRVLLVKPNYRDHWSLPGGICEHGEPPQLGYVREVAEEIGLELAPGPLIALDWARLFGPRQRPIMHFVFDGGTLDEAAGIVLQQEELDAFQFVGAADLAEYLPPRIRALVIAALAGRASGAAVYCPDQTA